MIGKKTLNVKAVSLSEVAEILEERAGGAELGFEQQSALEHAKKFAKLPAKKAVKLKEELEKLEKVTSDAAAKIADLLPKSKEEVELVFAKERYALSESDVQEVLEIVKKHA